MLSKIIKAGIVLASVGLIFISTPTKATSWVFVPTQASVSYAVPVIESQTEGVVDNAGSYDIPYPAGIVAGDLLLLITAMDGNDSLESRSGWLGYTPSIDGTNTATLYVDAKIANGTETGNLTLTLSSSERGESVMFRITGHDPSNYIGRSYDIFVSSGTSIGYYPNATTIPNTLVLAVTMTGNGGTTATFDTGVTDLYNNNGTPGGTGTGTASLHVGSLVKETTGSVSLGNTTINTASSITSTVLHIIPNGT